MLVGAQGVTVVGVGSQANPYSISGPHFATNNTSTVNLSLVGDGSAALPYTFKADALVSLDELTDVEASAPAAGNVLTWQTSPTPGWRPAPGNAVSPGLVNTDGLSIDGDGSGADPIRALLDSTGGLAVGAGGITTTRDIPVGPTTGRPSAPTEGRAYYDTTLDQLIAWDGGAWMAVGPPPTKRVWHAWRDHYDLVGGAAWGTACGVSVDGPPGQYLAQGVAVVSTQLNSWVGIAIDSNMQPGAYSSQNLNNAQLQMCIAAVFRKTSATQPMDVSTAFGYSASSSCAVYQGSYTLVTYLGP